MNITFNPSQNQYKSPNFTARLKGSAIKMAVKNAKDGFQFGEISEILENVKSFGDNLTKINCDTSGEVSVCNSKFSDFVYKFRLPKNNKSENPFLDMLRNFNSENSIMKMEYNLFNYIFEHSKNNSVRRTKYNFYSSLPMSFTTKSVLDAAAKKQGIISDPLYSPEGSKESIAKFEKLKEMFIKNIEKYN